jgi:hypothetical protein
MVEALCQMPVASRPSIRSRTTPIRVAPGGVAAALQQQFDHALMSARRGGHEECHVRGRAERGHVACDGQEPLQKPDVPGKRGRKQRVFSGAGHVISEAKRVLVVERVLAAMIGLHR